MTFCLNAIKIILNMDLVIWSGLRKVCKVEVCFFAYRLLTASLSLSCSFFSISSSFHAGYLSGVRVNQKAPSKKNYMRKKNCHRTSDEKCTVTKIAVNFYVAGWREMVKSANERTNKSKSLQKMKQNTMLIWSVATVCGSWRLSLLFAYFPLSHSIQY